MAKAIAQIRSLEKAIDLYELETGALPHSLADVEWDTVVDLWDNPYVYLNLAGTTVSGISDGGKGGKKAWSLFAPSAAYAASGGGSPLKPRKDRFLVPINSDYDLYSVGKDGESVAPLTAAKSRDDVVRANDGVFVGLATDF